MRLHLFRLKDKLYSISVTRNSNVYFDYLSYTETHRAEHLKHRYRSWILLLWLNVYHRFIRRYCVKPKTPDHPDPDNLIRELSDYDIVSFDIFDTLIFRSFSSPSAVFSLLEKKLGIANFSEVRKSAERELRNSSQRDFGHSEITITDIYRQVEKLTGLDASVGIKTELETESDICFANPYMKCIYDSLISSGKRIILISDMYLPAPLIHNILKKCGYTGYEKLYVSCDYNKSKATGEIYDLIRDELGEHFHYIQIGDNLHSDYRMAKNRGWKALHYQNVNEIVSQSRDSTIPDLFLSACDGIINAHLYNGSSRFSSEYLLGFKYFGPFMVGYIQWAHQYVRDQTIENIIILGGERALFQKIYSRLFCENTYGIKILYGDGHHIAKKYLDNATATGKKIAIIGDGQVKITSEDLKKSLRHSDVCYLVPYMTLNSRASIWLHHHKYMIPYLPPGRFSSPPDFLAAGCLDSPEVRLGIQDFVELYGQNLRPYYFSFYISGRAAYNMLRKGGRQRRALLKDSHKEARKEKDWSQ